jgi:hypothetical protein
MNLVRRGPYFHKFPPQQLSFTSANPKLIETLQNLPAKGWPIKNLPIVFLFGPSSSGKNTFTFQMWLKIQDNFRPYKILDLSTIKKQKDLFALLHEFEYGDLVLKNAPLNNKEILLGLKKWLRMYPYVRFVFYIVANKVSSQNFKDYFSNYRKIFIPGIAQRKEDILLLTKNFIGEIPGINFSKLAYSMLLNLEWESGIIELQATINYCLQNLKKNYSLEITSSVLRTSLQKAQQKLKLSYIVKIIDPSLFYQTATSLGVKELFARIELYLFELAEKESRGNISLASRRLGLPINTYIARKKRKINIQ